MLTFILRRFGLLIFTLFLTSVIVFAITQWLPGDPCRILLGREASQVQISQCRADLGLDLPAWQQYVRWLGNLLRGDWGISYSLREPALPAVLARLRNSSYIALLTLLFSVPIAILMGVWAGFNAQKPVDVAINTLTLGVVGLPEFVTGVVLIELLSFRLGKWLYPLTGWRGLPASSSIGLNSNFASAFPSLILPALTASLVLLAYLVRLTRAGVLAELRQGYVRTAQLKGLPLSAVRFRHVLRNALLPTITVIAISVGWLMSGLVVVENVFNYPGLGRLLVIAIERHDLPLLQLITMLTVTIFATANWIADLLYASLNPRIRLGE
jgi:peptide/nickel transport system permease protein